MTAKIPTNAKPMMSLEEWKKFIDENYYTPIKTLIEKNKLGVARSRMSEMYSGIICFKNLQPDARTMAEGKLYIYNRYHELVSLHSIALDKLRATNTDHVKTKADMEIKKFDNDFYLPLQTNIINGNLIGVPEQLIALAATLHGHYGVFEGETPTHKLVRLHKTVRFEELKQLWENTKYPHIHSFHTQPIGVYMWKTSDEIKSFFGSLTEIGIPHAPEKLMGFLLMYKDAVTLCAYPNAKRVGAINAMVVHHGDVLDIGCVTNLESKWGGLSIKWDKCTDGEEWDLVSFYLDIPMLYSINIMTFAYFCLTFIHPYLTKEIIKSYENLQTDFLRNYRERNFIGEYILNKNPNFKELLLSLVRDEPNRTYLQLYKSCA